MFRIFGKECLYIDIADTFNSQLLALSSFDDKASDFGRLMKNADTKFLLNGTTEESCFYITVPDSYSPEDIQLMADVIMRAIEKFGQAPVTVDGREQNYRIIINNAKEPEIIGIAKDKDASSFSVFAPIIQNWGKQNQ